MSMSFLSMVEAELPPGFRFHPRDDELVCDYLAPKAGGKVGFSGCRPPLVDVDLNKCEPWDLPAVASVGGKHEWYFFSLRDRKYATGQRTNRATSSGYWKATGKDRAVVRRGAVVGMRKTLVFYQGRAPKGRKTEWVMHEYRMDGAHEPPKLSSKGDWVLCRVLCKKKGGCHGGGGGGGTSKPRNLTTTSSPPLPPLMDTTNINLTTLAQTTMDTSAVLLEQVPCFSSLITSNTTVTPPPPCYYPGPMVTSSNNGMACLLEHDSMSDDHLAAAAYYLNCVDKKVLRAVLSHFSKFEGNNIYSIGEVVPSFPPPQMAAVNSSSSWINHF